MATYPTGIFSPTVVADNVDDVLASHQNVPNAEIVAVETAIGINPTTIDDTVVPAAPSSVADFMDKIANIVKTISGSTTWTNAAAAAIMKSIGTTKGDLIAFTGNATPVRFALGTTGQIAYVSTSTTGLTYDFPKLNLEDGSVINGKISPSVASGSITLALKTLAGNNPSTGEPVYIQIGDALRSVTSTLSVTVSQGSTNPFQAGSVELGTKEIDFFPYFAFISTSSAVSLGFARFPYARLYSDFSTASTAEKYGVFSTAPAATDKVIEFGRFAATVSTGSTYSWTVPTYTNANLIQKPIYETRTLSYSPVITAQAGAPTTVTSVSSYQIVGIKMWVSTKVTVTDKGTATLAIRLSPPLIPNASFGITGFESSVTGVQCIGFLLTNGIGLLKFDGTTLWVNGYTPELSGWMPLA